MIPNRFHFVFGLRRQRTPFHLVHYLCLASCLELNRPEAVYLYYLHEPYGRYWDLIKDRLILVKVPPVDFIENFDYPDPGVAQYRYAHASDFIRLERLLAHGGVYADMDTLFVHPIPAPLFQKSFVLGREDDVRDQVTGVVHPSVCNAFMMAERNAPFGRLWMARQQAAFDGSWSRHSTLLPYQLAQEQPQSVHIEPQRTFYRHMWTREGLHTLLEGCDRDTTGMVSIHLWAHLWWSRRRRDFSNFHAGRITEKFVRQVDTTYNLLARRHLPAPGLRAASPVRSRHWLSWVRDAAAACDKRATVLAKLSGWKRQNIVDSNAVRDAYGLDRMAFGPEDVVIDIGAHVGAFTEACARHGACHIRAYEPDIGHFRRLAHTARNIRGARLYNLAVFRSDLREEVPLAHSRYSDDNTGGGNVLSGEPHLDCRGRTLAPSTQAQRDVPTVALDEVLVECAEVRLLKLGCEGSEFPILLTSRELRRVQEILLECHECLPQAYAQLDPQVRLPGRNAFLAADLQEFLRAAGFTVDYTRTAQLTGYLRAWRASSP